MHIGVGTLLNRALADELVPIVPVRVIEQHTCATVVLPATTKVAKDLDLAVVDLYSAFQGREAAFTDADHLQVSAHKIFNQPECGAFKWLSVLSSSLLILQIILFM